MAKEPGVTPSALLRRLGLGRDTGRTLGMVLDTLVEEGRLERAGRRYRLPERAGREDWVGVFSRRGRGGVVTPYRDDLPWRVEIGPDDVGDAVKGDVVVVAPIAPPKKGKVRAARGRVVEVLGRPGTPEADFRAVVWRRQLPVEFPEAVVEEAEAIGSELDPAERARRVDLRELAFFTIDPATARDHDDAIHVAEERGGRARLWVAIADVSHYVTPGSALDREALRRGNSVYFPDRAIPMLPERLSGGICSLRPDEDRLAMVVELVLDRAGRVARRHFYPAVVRSRARLVYDEVAPVMEEGARIGLEPFLQEQLEAFARVAKTLMQRRFAAGSIDFDLPDAEIVLGDDRHPVDIRESPRTLANRAVEEAMLAANRAVAEALTSSKTPALYRNHEPPAPEALEALSELLAGFGLLRRGDDVFQPRVLARALESALGRPEERLVNTAVLRSMRLARYGAACAGHFALAFDHYTHFTSPIRRYADLAVHRALKQLLDGDGRARGERSDRDRLARVAERLSTRERVAVEAEREMVDLKKCAFMAGRVGAAFDATVTGVARHGLYLTLDEFFVEGLAHVSTLPEYVDHDERHFALVARRSGERYRLGDRFRVRLDAVDQIKAHINLSLQTRL